MNQNQIPFTVNIVTLNLFCASVTRQSTVMTADYQKRENCSTPAVSK